MTDYETALMRDINKFAFRIAIGVIIGLVALFSFFPIMGEIRFNVDGAMEGFNIITDRDGTCFRQEQKSMCSSAAWPLSIIWLLIAVGAGIMNGTIMFKAHNWYTEKRNRKSSDENESI